MKKVRNKWWIKNIIHYLIKWTDWFSEYNSYKFVSYLADASKTIFNYKHKFKCKHKEISNMNKASNFKIMIISHKQQQRWNHMFFYHMFALEFWSIFEWIVLYFTQSAIFFTLNHSQLAEQ